MTTGSEIVAHARQYVGTPFKHQGRHLGRALDCAGLIACVGRDAGVTSFDRTDYSRSPDMQQMKAVLDREMVSIPIAEAKPGDVFWCVVGSHAPQHLAIFTGTGLIHAFEPARNCVEHRVDKKWRRRIRAAYRYPDLET